jgi:adenylylsulfate kinase-like enzyme
MQRDPKGLYQKAIAGEIKNFTGIDSPYEAPERAEIVLKTAQTDPEELAGQVVNYLRRQEIVP